MTCVVLSPIMFVLTWDTRQIGHRCRCLPLHRWPLCSNSLRHLRLPKTRRQVKTNETTIFERKKYMYMYIYMKYLDTIEPCRPPVSLHTVGDSIHYWLCIISPESSVEIFVDQPIIQQNNLTNTHRSNRKKQETKSIVLYLQPTLCWPGYSVPPSSTPPLSCVDSFELPVNEKVNYVLKGFTAKRRMLSL